MPNNITVSLNTVSVNNNIISGDASGVYVLGGYQKNDSNSDGLLDSVNFDPLEVYGVSKVIDDVELDTWHYELTKLSSEDVSDYMPTLSGPSSSESTGATSPELLAIEQEKLALEKERREEEKIAHKNLFSTEKKVITDIMGNEEEITEGYYPAVREHKVLESNETNYSLNVRELYRQQTQAYLHSILRDLQPDESSLTVPRDSSIATSFDSVEVPTPDYSGVSIGVEAFQKFKGF